jgi:biotin-dependent carboxylase-like uncharacterized protein
VISLLRAPPFATVQDLGRPNHLAAAVPLSGALDRFSLAAGNLLVGNPRDAAGLEWGLGGGKLRFEQATAFLLLGAHCAATLGHRAVDQGVLVQAAAAEVLEVHRLERSAWLYLAVAGGIDVPVVLGSRSTYLPARFGGFEGRTLRSGDRLPVGAAPLTHSARNAPWVFLEPDEQPIRILPGPDIDMLEPGDWERFVEAEYHISRAASRMGYRLEARGSRVRVTQDRPSAPVCVGTIQLPAGGEPIVLLADGPTVGGYARIAVVATADIGRLAQRRPGDPVRFRVIGLEEATQILQEQAGLLNRLEEGA